MTSTFKLTITWLLLVCSSILSLFVVNVNGNDTFVSILAYKKFLLIGFVYLEGMKAHWVYRILILIAGSALIVGDYIWGLPRTC